MSGTDFAGWRTSAAFLLTLLAVPAAATAQDPATVQLDEVRTYLVDAFARNRAMDLAYLAAAPDSVLRWAPTDGVRDFAAQIAHTTHDFFRPWRSEAPADSSSYLNDPEVLATNVGAGYDWAIEYVRTASDEELLAEQEILGEPRPLWRVMQYWLDHAMWTRASVIPYLRLNGVTPPPVRFW